MQNQHSNRAASHAGAQQSEPKQMMEGAANLSSSAALPKMTGGSYTPGKFVFDATAYGGINYLLNGAVSVALAYYAREKAGSFLNKGYEGTLNFLRKGLSEKSANTISEFAWLGSGGFIVLLPIKWIEDRKPDLVRYADKVLGAYPKDEKEQAAYEASIEAEPRQSVMSLLGGRMVSLAGVVGVAWATSKLTEPWINRAAEKMTPLFEKAAKNTEVAEKVSGITAQELWSCLVGTALLYGSSKAIAGINHYYRDGREAAEARAREERGDEDHMKAVPSAHQVNVAELIGRVEAQDKAPEVA